MFGPFEFLALKPNYYAISEGGMVVIVHGTEPEVALVEWCQGTTTGPVNVFAKPGAYALQARSVEQLRSFYADRKVQCPFDFDSEVPMTLRSETQTLRMLLRQSQEQIENLAEKLDITRGQHAASLREFAEIIDPQMKTWEAVYQRRRTPEDVHGENREYTGFLVRILRETFEKVAAQKALTATRNYWAKSCRINAPVDKGTASK